MGFAMSRYPRFEHLAHFLQRLGDQSLALLFATECLLCGTAISVGPACANCQILTPLEPPFCERCGHPLATTMKECGTCVQMPCSPLTSIRSGFWLDDRARALWGRIKFHRRYELLPVLAGQIKMLDRGIAIAEGAVVPVPLSLQRFIIRGMNQSEWLARQWRTPVLNGLVKTLDRGPQSLLNSAERRRNVRGSFNWQAAEKPPEQVILIDDIYTTGSTIRECARVLVSAGCKKVSAWTLFRTPHRFNH